jgi:hypothetical protein
MLSYSYFIELTSQEQNLAEWLHKLKAYTKEDVCPIGQVSDGPHGGNSQI